MCRMRWTSVVVMAAGVAAAAPADEVRLRGAVRLPADATVVRLADVAELAGPAATALADVVVAEMSGPEVQIAVAQVRRALSGAGAHWGRVNLSGRVVSVRSTRAADGSGPMAMSPVSISGASAAPAAGPEGAVAAGLLDEPTLRGDLARFLAVQLGVDAGELRLLFREQDRPALQASSAGHRFEKQPHGRLDNEVVELTVRAWRGDGIAATWVVRVGVEQRVTGLRARRAIARGEPLVASDFEPKAQWMSLPAARQLAGAAALPATTAASSIAQGQILRRTDLCSPILVERGDIAMVRCVVGGLVISLKAEARADGARGQTIPFRKAREREDFLATVTGPAEAVVNLGPGGAQ